MDVQVIYANQERYTHPEKTTITPFNISSNDQLEFIETAKPWVINNSKVTVSLELTHLGIQRSNIQVPNSIQPVVKCRLITVRKTT